MGNYTQDDGRSSTFGRNMMSYIANKLPYASNLANPAAEDLNPKYKYFEGIGTHRAEILSKHSITQSNEYNAMGAGEIHGDQRYNQVMYANIQKDKGARIRDYRIIAAYAEVADALDEICDESINKDEYGQCSKLVFKNCELTDFQKDELKKEYNKYIQYFDLENKGWEYIRQLLVEGEIFWEHIIHKDHINEGILGVVQVPCDLVDPIYSNIQNVMCKGFLYRKPIFDPNNPMKQLKVEFIPMEKSQVTYINSGIWNENRTMRLPFIENCRRAYRQLSLIEDSIVIQRLVRAPARLVFNVDVGNMPAPKAEAYIKKLISNYWSSKTFDNNQNSMVQKTQVQSQLDSYWFAKRAGSTGTDVRQLEGGASFQALDDLYFFVKKLYKALKVPTTRLDPNDAFRDGQDMLREELKFARFVIRLQQHVAAGLTDGLVTHLQLKGLWQEYGLKEQNIGIEFNVPTNFYELRENQKLELKLNNFNSLLANASIAPTFGQKKILGWSDTDILANREFLRKDKELVWELTQIEQLGPKWKEIAAAQAQAGGEVSEGGEGVGAPGFGPGSMPPSFGSAAAVGGAPGEGGGETPAPAGNAPAPAGNA